jgi:hypothetical protein
MLQWIGDTKNIIFNDYNGDRNVARIFDIKGNLLKTLPRSIGAISPDGNFALAYSFERTAVYHPGYGYANGKDTELDEKLPKSHGISIINLSNDSDFKMLFSVNEIANFNWDSSMEDCFHWISHCQFSPNSKRFKFFHRWIKNMNHIRTRMITCDLNGENIHIFKSDGMVSHVGWNSDEKLVAYARLEGIGDRYVMFHDMSNEMDIIGEKFFSSDGHPSFSQINNYWMLTDTYPDRFRNSFLILYDLIKDKGYNLLRLRIPKEFASPNFESNWQCDFHPRWDRDGDYICFDSAHTGIRSLCTIKLDSNLKELSKPQCI